MIRLRRAIGPLAAAWLVCQAATLSLIPALSATAVAVVAIECTCSHGDHATCPMHHKPAGGAERCTMRSTGDTGTAVMVSLFGPLGLLSQPSAILGPPPAPTPRSLAATTATLRHAPPDPPPPRA